VPELPEAETIVRGLRPAIVGETIRRTEVLRPDILREPKVRFATKVRGRAIASVGRRGKNVVITLDDDRVIAINLGMTGRLLPFQRPPRGSARPGHAAVRFRFESGGILVFDDTRRFGTVECLTADEWMSRSARLGPEPLAREYDAHELQTALSASRSPIRSWLLDQRRVAGVGNIYANEALYLAGVHPQRPARSVTAQQAVALHGAIRSVLRNAIEMGGTTIRDYRTAGGEEGGYAPLLYVYGRDGQACLGCGSRIRKVVFGNRSAFYCPTCQRDEVGNG
jgi:formamidopyrimidine-DNA glycosylase